MSVSINTGGAQQRAANSERRAQEQRNATAKTILTQISKHNASAPVSCVEYVPVFDWRLQQRKQHGCVGFHAEVEVHVLGERDVNFPGGHVHSMICGKKLTGYRSSTVLPASIYWRSFFEPSVCLYYSA